MKEALSLRDICLSVAASINVPVATSNAALLDRPPPKGTEEFIITSKGNYSAGCDGTVRGGRS